MKKIGAVFVALGVAGGAVYWIIATNFSKRDFSASRPRNGPAQEAPKPVPKPPEPAAAPLKVEFKSKTPPELGKPAPVMLVVESDREAWPAEAAGEGRLELLLRLPPGVKMASDGWSPTAPSTEEKKDGSGPWSLYEKQLPLNIPAGAPPEVLAEEEVRLTVAEEGVNWIITARARVVRGTSAWQAFGVLFATLQGDSGEFHQIPKGPADIRSAQAS